MNTTEQHLPFSYSEEELLEFKNNILLKLEKASKELDYLGDLFEKSDPEKNKSEYIQLQQMAERQQTFINNLNAALERIENKSYGICRITGKLIDRARLMAVPHATLSLEAKLGSNKNAPDVPVIGVPEKPKKQKAKKEKPSAKVSDEVRYSDDDLRNFKTIISNKIDEANHELKYLNVVLHDRNLGIKVEGYEDMTPAEVEELIIRKKSFVIELENAIDRIKKKTYGVCEETGQLIPKEILLQHPIIKRLQPTPEHPSSTIENKYVEPVRKCRICGCTQNDCRQCIEKTGQPCYWIDTDLCSACEEEAMKQSDAGLTIESAPEPELENLITQSNNENDMNFFSQLAHAGAGAVDMTMRIMQKNDKLTINIMPGAGSTSLQPILVTGTPEELDAEFFKTIAPGVHDIKGMISNIEAVKKDLASQNKKPATPAAPSKPTKPAKKSAPKKEKAKAEVKEEASPAPDPAVEEEVAPEETITPEENNDEE